MKKISLVFALLVSTQVFAEEGDRASMKAECKPLLEQCKSAGFMPGDHKKNGKGAWVDCIGAVSKGKTVAGVSFTADQANACRNAHKAVRKSK